MCLIEEVPSFRYGGKLYDREDDAIIDALTDIGKQMRAETSTGPGTFLVKNRKKLITLLVRLDEITETSTSTEVASEESSTTLLVEEDQ